MQVQNIVSLVPCFEPRTLTIFQLLFISEAKRRYTKLAKATCSMDHMTLCLTACDCGLLTNFILLRRYCHS